MYILKYENVERVVVTDFERDILIKKGYILCENIEKQEEKPKKAGGGNGK